MYSNRSKVAKRRTFAKKGSRKIIRRTFRKAAVAPIVAYYPSMPTKGNMSKTGVPNTMSVQLKAMDNVAVAPAALYQTYAFKLTSTYNPFGAMSAVQPIGRDQLAALYASYIVESGMVKIRFENTNDYPCIVAMYTSSQAAVAADINNYMGQPGSVYKTVGGKGVSGELVLKRTFKARQILGPLDRSSHGAGVGADPTSMAYLYIMVKSTNTNATGHLVIEVDQNTTFYDKTAVIHA